MTLLDAPIHDLDSGERAELERYRAAFGALADVAQRVARGDLDARLGHLGEDHDLVTTRWSINRLLDLTDAFVRSRTS